MEIKKFGLTDDSEGPLPKLNSSVGGLTYSAAVVSMIIMTLVFAIVLLVLKAAGVDGVALLYLQFLVSPAAIAVAVTAICKKFKIELREIVPAKCKPKYYIMAVLLIFGLLFALSWINTVTVEFFKLFGYEENATLEELEEYLSTMPAWGLLPALIIIAVIPAVMEELLFRGLILRACHGTAGSIATVLLCGFAFSLYHGSPEQTVYQFLLGCIFALITIRSGSILPAIIMHFINNGLVVFLCFFNAYTEDGALNAPVEAQIALIVMAVVCMIGGTVWLILDKTPLTRGRKGSVKTFFLFAAVGIAIMALLWICSLFGVT